MRKGFAPIVILLVVLAIVVVGVAWYWKYEKNRPGISIQNSGSVCLDRTIIESIERTVESIEKKFESQTVTHSAKFRHVDVSSYLDGTTPEYMSALFHIGAMLRDEEYFFSHGTLFYVRTEEWLDQESGNDLIPPISKHFFIMDGRIAEKIVREGKDGADQRSCAQVPSMGLEGRARLLAEASSKGEAMRDAVEALAEAPFDDPMVSSSGTNTSILTSLAGSNCKTLVVDTITGDSTRECPGVAGYKLLVHDGDARMSVTVVMPNGTQHNLNYWDVITRHFSTLGEQAEWRFQNSLPIALIVPVIAQESGDNGKEVRFLAVAKITPKAICVTDRIAPGTTAAETARAAADASENKACLRDIP